MVLCNISNALTLGEYFLKDLSNLNSMNLSIGSISLCSLVEGMSDQEKLKDFQNKVNEKMCQISGLNPKNYENEGVNLIPEAQAGLLNKETSKFSNAFVTFVDLIVKLVDSVGWVICHPIQALLALDRYVFYISTMCLLILFITSILVKMLTGEDNLYKVKNILKTVSIVTFALGLVLKSFVTLGVQ